MPPGSSWASSTVTSCPRAQQVVRGRQPGRPGADDRDALAGRGSAARDVPGRGREVGVRGEAVERRRSRPRRRRRSGCSAARTAAGTRGPSAAGSVRKSAAMAAAWARSPSATCERNPGMSNRAGQAVVQGPTQSPTWSDSSSSSAILRDARTSSVSVRTTMPGATGMAHDGVSAALPSTFTAHRKHDADGRIPVDVAERGDADPERARRGEDRRPVVDRHRPAVDRQRDHEPLRHLDGLLRAGRHAHAAARAALVDRPRASGRAAARWRRPGTPARRACSRCSASVHAVVDQRLARAGRAAPLADVRLVLVAEVAQRRQHRVGRGLAEAAQAALS